MRILHIVGSINPAAGGPTEAIRMLVRHAPAGFTAELATLDDPAAPFLREFDFPMHALGRPGGGWYSPRFLPWLQANRERFDGAIVHGLWMYSSFAARRAFAGRLPYVVFVHGMLDPYFKRAFPAKHLKKWPYWLFVERHVLHDAHRVLFTTALERDLATRNFAFHHWQSAVVPLGTEGPPTDEANLREAFLSQHPELRGRRFLLSLGRIDPKKGCDLLLRAFAAVAGSDPGLHLVMAGPDANGWRAQLHAIAEAAGVAERVHWTGMLRGETKWGAFAAAEAFVLPSHQENFGIAAVEALASGLPVLLTHPVNIAPDLAAEGCALVDEDSEQGVEALLRRWIATASDERAAMSRRARETFTRSYDMRRNTEAILRVLEIDRESDRKIGREDGKADARTAAPRPAPPARPPRAVEETR